MTLDSGGSPSSPSTRAVFPPSTAPPSGAAPAPPPPASGRRWGPVSEQAKEATRRGPAPPRGAARARPAGGGERLWARDVETGGEAAGPRRPRPPAQGWVGPPLPRAGRAAVAVQVTRRPRLGGEPGEALAPPPRPVEA